MKRVVSAISLIALTLSLWGGIASPEPVTVTQPDGTKLTVKIRGDEHQHWIETLEGYTIIKNRASKTWEYARQGKNGSLQPSGIAVSNIEPAPGNTPKHLMPARDMDSERLAHEQHFGKAAGEWEPSLVSGQRNLLFIAVNFSDRSLTTTTQQWHDTIFDGTPGVKSVVNYYDDQSRGLLTPVPAPNSQSSLGVVEVTINKRHPNTGNSTQGTSRKYSIETAWINDALAAASSHVDFNALDTNGDNDLTLDEAVVYFIVAGWDASGSAKEPSVWAHKWSAWSPGDVQVNGVNVNRWAINGELYDDDLQHPMGVITHELGHLMCALPDLYDISNGNAALGSYSLMASGSWTWAYGDARAGDTPVNMDAWCRYVVGWATPRSPADGATVSFGAPLASADAPVILRDTSSSQSEFFLVENRPPVGWDLGLSPALEVQMGFIDDNGNTINANPMTYSPAGSATGVAVDCARGLTAADFPPSVAGNIALIERGDTDFVVKSNNAKAAGALACIIYNNTTGEVNGTLGSAGDYIPTVGILQADGPGLAGKTVTVDVTIMIHDGGLLVQHIDDSVGSRSSNNINSSSNNHQGVTVEEADPTVAPMLVSGGSSGDIRHLYWAGNNDAFTPNTSPNSDYYTGQASGLGIQSISARGATMSGTIIGGGSGSNPLPPAAGFSYTATLLDVSFTDSSVDSDGSIVGWSWNFGDGNTSSVQNPSHSYTAAGNYTVSLTVTDSDGLTDATSQTVTVSQPGGTTTDNFSGQVRGTNTATHTISVSGGVIDLNLTWNTSHDVDLFLLAPGGAQVASSTGSGQPETISYDTGGANGTYTIQVVHNGAKKDRANYTLSATYEP